MCLELLRHVRSLTFSIILVLLRDYIQSAWLDQHCKHRKDIWNIMCVLHAPFETAVAEERRMRYPNISSQICEMASSLLNTGIAMAE